MKILFIKLAPGQGGSQYLTTFAEKWISGRYEPEGGTGALSLRPSELLPPPAVLIPSDSCTSGKRPVLEANQIYLKITSNFSWLIRYRSIKITPRASISQNFYIQIKKKKVYSKISSLSQPSSIEILN